jgi:hypothetical protein
MRVKCFFLSLIVIAWILWSVRAEAFVFINEFFADPASGLAGDANGDGVRDSSDDEFVELFNSSTNAVDISSWSISDASLKRHVFTAGSIINPNSTFVVFGGGQPKLTKAPWQIASQGSLNLNNTADTITLYDVNGKIIDTVTYGAEADKDQSIVRSPEGTEGAWVKHTTLPNANGQLFSPGYLVNDVQHDQSTVPEPATLVSLMGGLSSAFFMRRKKSGDGSRD